MSPVFDHDLVQLLPIIASGFAKHSSVSEIAPQSGPLVSEHTTLCQPHPVSESFHCNDGIAFGSVDDLEFVSRVISVQVIDGFSIELLILVLRQLSLSRSRVSLQGPLPNTYEHKKYPYEHSVKKDSKKEEKLDSMHSLG